MHLQVSSATIDDMAWIYELYCQTMKPFVEETWGWDEQLQFDGINKQLGAESFELVSLSKDIVGCFCAKAKEDCLWLHLILIKPHFQRRGIGRWVMEHLQAIANELRKPLRFRAIKTNPASDFYRHIGYSQYNEDETRYYFEKNS